MMRAQIAVAALLVATVPAHAAEPVSPPAGIDIRIERTLAAPPAVVFDRIVAVDRWWNPQHSYSGKAANLRIEPRAGGCFCEVWAGGSVEHGRVLMAMPGRLLRFSAALGPLQERPVAGVLGFTLAAVEGGGATRLVVHYRVAGAVDDLRAPVTEVITEQVDRLAAGFAAGGSGQ